MKKQVKNLPASVHGRLNHLARETKRSFQEVFHYYAMERFLYRLSQSPYCNNFVLKGGLAFSGWGITLRRPTKDIDFQAYQVNGLEDMVRIVKEICNTRCEDSDGMVFDAASVTGLTIMGDAEHPGIRVRFKGYLDQAYVWLQVDCSFANVITPQEVEIEYPTLLNMPDFKLKSYNPETAIAEKLQAMIFLGSFNDRMKDFYDIYLLSRECDFDGPILVQAIKATFRNRKTELPLGLPLPLTDGFASLKQSNWQQFMRGVIQGDIAPTNFSDILDALRKFLIAPLDASVQGEQFLFQWKAGHSWVSSGDLTMKVSDGNGP